MLYAWLVVPEIKRYVCKGIAVVACLGEQLVDAVSEIPFVLGLAGKGFAVEPDDLGAWVVAGPAEFDEFITLELG